MDFGLVTARRRAPNVAFNFHQNINVKQTNKRNVFNERSFFMRAKLNKINRKTFIQSPELVSL